MIRLNNDWLANYIIMLILSVAGLVLNIALLFTIKNKRSQSIFIYSILCFVLWFLKIGGFDNFCNRNMNKLEFIESYEFIRGLGNQFTNVNLIFVY